MPSSAKKSDRTRQLPAAEVALIFDMDGTLLDGREAVVDAVREGLAATYRHFDLPVPPLDRDRIAAAIGLPTPAFFRAVFDPLTVPGGIQDRFVGEFEVRSTRAEVAALERGDTELYAGVELALETLVERGHPLALFSNANAPYFDAVVRAHKLDRYFNRTVSLELAVRHRVARTKTGIVAHLARNFTQSVVIGDRIHDIEAGRSSGARTVGCLYGFGKPVEFTSADWTISQLPEILELPLTTPASLI
ncbi:MAG: HAD family hydrolase [bacterium]